MKTKQQKPAPSLLWRRLHQLTYVLGAVLLFGTTALAGPNRMWVTTVGLTGGASIAPSPRVLAIDAFGASYIVGYGHSGLLTPATAYVAKVDVNGNFIWLTSYSAIGLSSSAQFTDGAIDTNGELVATGFVDEAATPSVWVTIKLDPTTGAPSTSWPDVGSGVGVRVISSPGANRKGSRCRAEPAGAVVVSGTSDTQLFMVLYNSGGSPSTSWPDIGDGTGVRTYTPAGGVVDLDAPAIVQTDSGNYYLAGTGVAGALGLDYIAAKFDSTGTFLWGSDYSTNFSGTDRVSDMTVDSSGNCFVTGESFDVPNSQNEMALVRFNNSGGGTAWSARSTGEAVGRKVVVGPGGSVYVAGKSVTNATMNVWKFTSAGAPSTTTWPASGGSPAGVRRLGGAAGDQGEDILLDNGQLYVIGKIINGTSYMTTWNIDAANGTTGWIEYFGTAGMTTSGVAIKILGGFLIGTGFTHPNPGGGPDSLVVMRYIP
jgi:hypothetical protein